jgi:hypothetical protein
VWLEDAAGNADSERGRVTRLRLDDVAPRSTGFDAPDPADPRGLSLPIVDDLSGIGSATIELRRRGEGDWHPLATGIDGGRALAHVPDEQLADGGYDVRAIVRDQAGNQAVVTTDRDGRPKAIALPLRAPVRVTGRATAVALPVRRCRRVRARLRCVTTRPAARSVPLGGAALVVPNGRTAAVTARLEAVGGRGVTGAPVAVLERVRGTAHWHGLVRLTSGPGGDLAYTAPPGPARQLRLAYAGDPLLLPASADLVLRVPAAGTLTVDRRVVRNGGSVRFRGRLLGGPVPRSGRRVALQAYFRGAWRTFATPRTTSAGRWTAPYRFGATFRRVAYRFRALIYTEPSYPYDAGLTPELRVTVTP